VGAHALRLAPIAATWTLTLACGKGALGGP
jgi:hypothetical protein